MPKLWSPSQVEEEDSREYTRVLFASLVRQRLEEEGVPHQEIENDPRLDFLRIPGAQSVYHHLGEDLRRISEEFEKSPHRVLVYERSKRVSFDKMEYEHFRTFLDELFLDGVTRERIVILFTFCADVLLRAYDSAFANLQKLFEWFLYYIIEKVCAWVESHGGWSRVLSVHLPQLSKTVLCMMASAVLAVVLIRYLP